MNRNPHTYLIIGCGHFGSRAAEKLKKRNSRSKIIVVDKSKKALQKVSRFSIQTEVSSGISYLNQFLSEGRKADYIIPAIPLHLAFEFILSQMKPWGAKRKEIPPRSGLPNPVIGKTGNLYISLSNFLCSEDCRPLPSWCKSQVSITRNRLLGWQNGMA